MKTTNSFFSVLLLFVALLAISPHAHAVSYTKVSTGGTAYSSSYYNSSFVAAKAFDGSLSTNWLSTNGSLPAWLKYKLPASRAVSRYQIYSSEYFSPRTWKFQGWNGSSWVTLDTRSGYTSWTSGTAKTFNITNTNRYQYYRIYITATNPLVYYGRWYYTGISELILYTHSVPIANFAPSKSPINIGDSSKLSWTSTYALSASINQGIGPVAVNDSQSVKPRIPTTYKLTTIGVSGNTYKYATIDIFDPTVEGFEANDSLSTAIVSGDPLTFDWAATNVTSVSIDNGVGYVYGPDSSGTASINGSKVIYPTSSSITTKTYTITAEGPGGTANKTVTLTVYPDTTDSDNDGMADRWELFYFGTLDENAYEDDDGDGYMNIVEYRSGADPTKRSSIPNPGLAYEYDEQGRIKSILLNP